MKARLLACLCSVARALAREHAVQQAVHHQVSVAPDGAATRMIMQQRARTRTRAERGAQHTQVSVSAGWDCNQQGCSSACAPGERRADSEVRHDEVSAAPASQRQWWARMRREMHTSQQRMRLQMDEGRLGMWPRVLREQARLLHSARGAAASRTSAAKSAVSHAREATGRCRVQQPVRDAMPHGRTRQRSRHACAYVRT
jgi:hypothetical protein